MRKKKKVEEEIEEMEKVERRGEGKIMEEEVEE